MDHHHHPPSSVHDCSALQERLAAAHVPTRRIRSALAVLHSVTQRMDNTEQQPVQVWPIGTR